MLRLAFMGTPEFAVPALRALHTAGHTIAAVYAQPPKPSGRGQRLQISPVQMFAAAHGLPIFTPKSLRTAEAQAEFTALELDVAIVAAYGLILPPLILTAPRHGCLNIHASLLPRWRGAAPIHRAILAGDAETGITIMQMDAGLDTGAMLRHSALPIPPRATAGELHDRLAALGADLIVPTLADHVAGRLTPEPQPADGVTYAAKLQKSEGALEWSQPAMALDRQVRGLQPWPGTFFRHQDETVKLLAATIAAGRGAPGTVLDSQATIACGQDALRLLKVQRAGKAPVNGVDFLNGLRLGAGAVLANGG